MKSGPEAGFYHHYCGGYRMKKGRHIFVKALCAVLAFAIIFSVSACQGNSNTEEAQSVTAEPVENGLSAYELAVQ